MGDEPSSGVAPRKMKFAPKIPPRKIPKSPLLPKAEQPESGAGDVIDRALLRRVKIAAQRSGRKSLVAERKAATMEVAFGHVGTRTSARSFGISGTEKNHEDVADTPSSKQNYVDPWDYYSYYPVILPLRRPYSGNPERLDEEEFGECSTSAEYDETKINCAEELGLKDDSANGQMLFFQLPASLPLGRRPHASVKGKETDAKGMGVLEKGQSLNDLPAGFMGKMLVYKSGVVKMKLGDTIFDVSPGLDCVFAQDVMAINTRRKHCCALGELNKHAVVRPDVDHLLSSLTE